MWQNLPGSRIADKDNLKELDARLMIVPSTLIIFCGAP